MKNKSIWCFALLSIALQSCKNNESENADKDKKVETAKIISTDCYKAIYEADTLDLQINTLEDGEITGDLMMNIANTPVRSGEVVGKFSGDTLYASYTFIEGENKKITFKNPMAFLKRNNQLILGNGQIVTTMGASYFEKGTKIDYDNVKYKFDAVACADSTATK
ncbi:hypothetical protein [Flavobacterium algicola]|uniref:hypothetical protein n=1 Tax=Flavobacterium algicola TaxID=556529 RepID=UPI001EFDB7E8|nr:hypothetical protein [Flavobacterium algicola]MCG9793811.1 hypothetical protein [Flavobacterium algicola]